jgi:excinuclease UvrABC ATPase subunit
MERECSNCKGVGFVKFVAEPVVVKRKRRTPAEMLMMADIDKGL